MHAYLIISQNQNPDFTELLPNIDWQNLPIVKHYFNKLKIEDVRELNAVLNTRINEVHIIYFNNFLYEAQNAFLKTLEEPAPGKIIILYTASNSLISDTILSRVNLVVDSLLNGQIDESNFLQVNKKARFEIVKNILDGEHDLVRQNAQKLIGQILTNDKLEPSKRKILAQFNDELYANGSSPKQILEFIAISL